MYDDYIGFFMVCFQIWSLESGIVAYLWFIRSLFDESGAMRAKSKAVLKTKLQVEKSNLIQGVPADEIIDECAML